MQTPAAHPRQFQYAVICASLVFGVCVGAVYAYASVARQLDQIGFGSQVPLPIVGALASVGSYAAVCNGVFVDRAGHTMGQAYASLSVSLSYFGLAFVVAFRPQGEDFYLLVCEFFLGQSAVTGFLSLSAFYEEVFDASVRGSLTGALLASIAVAGALATGVLEAFGGSVVWFALCMGVASVLSGFGLVAAMAMQVSTTSDRTNNRQHFTRLETLQDLGTESAKDLEAPSPARLAIARLGARTEESSAASGNGKQCQVQLPLPNIDVPVAATSHSAVMTSRTGGTSGDGMELESLVGMRGSSREHYEEGREDPDDRQGDTRKEHIVSPIDAVAGTRGSDDGSCGAGGRTGRRARMPLRVYSPSQSEQSLSERARSVHVHLNGEPRSSRIDRRCGACTSELALLWLVVLLGIGSAFVVVNGIATIAQARFLQDNRSSGDEDEKEDRERVLTLAIETSVLAFSIGNTVGRIIAGVVGDFLGSLGHVRSGCVEHILRCGGRASGGGCLYLDPTWDGSVVLDRESSRYVVMLLAAPMGALGMGLLLLLPVQALFIGTLLVGFCEGCFFASWTVLLRVWVVDGVVGGGGGRATSSDSVHLPPGIQDAEVEFRDDNDTDNGNGDEDEAGDEDAHLDPSAGEQRCQQGRMIHAGGSRTCCFTVPCLHLSNAGSGYSYLFTLVNLAIAAGSVGFNGLLAVNQRAEAKAQGVESGRCQGGGCIAITIGLASAGFIGAAVAVATLWLFLRRKSSYAHGG